MQWRKCMNFEIHFSLFFILRFSTVHFHMIYCQDYAGCTVRCTVQKYIFTKNASNGINVKCRYFSNSELTQGVKKNNFAMSIVHVQNYWMSLDDANQIGNISMKAFMYFLKAPCLYMETQPFVIKCDQWFIFCANFECFLLAG